MTTEATERVLADIRTERIRQVADGWTPEHDDTHTTHDMVRLAETYAHKPETDRPEHRGLYSRYRLVQAATLLVATIEAMDRQEDQ